MKRFTFLFSMVLCLSFASCELFENEELIALEDLPTAVISYVAENYPSSTIIEAEKEEEDGEVKIEVELDTGEELYFDEDGNFLGEDEDDD